MQIIYSDSQRLQWVDAMRGFSMFIVVLGHVLLSMGIGGYNSFLSSVLLTFRMPLFFFVSGFFSYRAVEWWTKRRVGDILKRKFQAQILCTIVFFSVYQYFVGGGISFHQGFREYWFTIVLFQMYACYLVLSIVSRIMKVNIVIPGLIILSALCVGIIAFRRGDSYLWTFLCWENFTKYMQFFTLGVICSGYKERFFRLLSNNAFITIVTLGWIVCMMLWYSDGFKTCCPFAYSAVHDIVVRYCALMTVVAAFFGSAQVMSSDAKWCRCLRFVGQRTLDIYMIHYFFIPNLGFLSDFMQRGNMLILQLLVSVVIAALIVMMSLVVSMILRRSKTLECWLFGVKPRV